MNIEKKLSIENVKWIIDDICKKEEISPDAICNLGYACDGCPFNDGVIPAKRYPEYKGE